MSIDLSLYPQFDDGQLVSPGVGQYSIYTRQGGQQTPTVDVLGTYVGQSYGSRLNPNTRMVVAGTSASLPGLVAVQNPTGCNTPTGQEIPIALPYDLTTQFDLYGLPTIGSPQAGDAIQTLLTSNNDPVVSYRVTDPKVKGKAKYLSGAYAGEATKITAYGDYPWIDDNGKQYPSLGKADPSRLKPRWDLLYNHGQFRVDPKTNELNLTTHGGDGSAYGQGKNILLIPGAPPTLAMTVTVNAGGSVDVGGRLIAYSRTIADPLGTLKDTDLSPVAYVNTITGLQSIAYSIPPATDVTRATEYKIWSTKPNDPTGDFYLADTKTGIDPTTTVTGTLSAADASLSTVFVGTQTVIHVDDNVSLFGVLRADGGTQTISVPHTPVVDADIPWPTTFGTIRDGLTAVSTADDSFQWRSNNAWHSITAGGGGGSSVVLATVETLTTNTHSNGHIPSFTNDTLNFDIGSGPRIDLGGWVSGGSTDAYLVVPETGAYEFSVILEFALSSNPSSGNVFAMTAQTNGTNRDGQNFNITGLTDPTIQWTHAMSLTAGDHFTLFLDNSTFEQMTIVFGWFHIKKL